MTRTPARSVRVPDHMWNAAKARAEFEGTTVTAIILRALDHPPIVLNMVSEVLRREEDDARLRDAIRSALHKEGFVFPFGPARSSDYPDLIGIAAADMEVDRLNEEALGRVLDAIL